MRCPFFLALPAIAVGTMLNTLSLTHAEEEQFPYIAFVEHSEAPVRSGPERDFYETDRLVRGSKVEVYRHDNGDWCAVRPPAGSFSWVAANHVELTENPSLARVVTTPVKTRVGSRFNDIHDVEYISLREGEILEILGRETLREASGAEPREWLKVAPPAGEFRWIHKRYLSSQPPLPHETTALPDEDAPTASLASDQPTVQPGMVPTYPLTEPAVSIPAEHPDESAAGESAAKVAFKEIPWQELPADDARGTANEVDQQTNGQVQTATWHAAGDPGTLLTAPEPRSFRERSGELNLMLSQAVLGDIDDWQLADIAMQTRALVAQAESPGQRDEAEALLSKVVEFQRLQSRHRQLLRDNLQEPTLSEPSLLVDISADAALSSAPPQMPHRISSPTVRTASAENVTDDDIDPAEALAVGSSIFDATGHLISVITRRKGMPKFALTDDKGRILRFVSAQDGVNLSHFANQKVGIIGKPGYLREFRKPLVTARRIVTLQR